MDRFRGVRARVTIVATIVVFLVLSLAAAGMALLLRNSLLDNVDRNAIQHTASTRALLASGQALRRIPAPPDGATIVVLNDRRVEASATFDLNARSPIDLPQVSAGNQTIEGVFKDQDADARVAASSHELNGEKFTVIVIANLSAVERTIDIVENLLYVAIPTLTALLALIIWRVAGRALAPVEEMRRQVSEISEKSLSRRVSPGVAKDEIARLAHTMNSMLDRLEAASERQKRFAADASHELLTPLASARTALEVARQSQDGDWRGMADSLLATNKEMERLVSNLLYLAQSDAGAPRDGNRLIDFDDVVLEACAAHSRDGVVVDASGVSAAPVRGRRDDLTRMFRNLLTNALRHARTRVDVALSLHEDFIVLTVGDDGPGVPLADRDAVFERFRRLESARDRASGARDSVCRSLRK